MGRKSRALCYHALRRATRWIKICLAWSSILLRKAFVRAVAASARMVPVNTQFISTRIDDLDDTKLPPRRTDPKPSSKEISHESLCLCDLCDDNYCCSRLFPCPRPGIKGLGRGAEWESHDRF